MRHEVGQVLVRNVRDDALGFFKLRAKLNGTSMEQEIRSLIEEHTPLSSDEKVAMLRHFRSRTKPGAALSLDEIREGLE